MRAGRLPDDRVFTPRDGDRPLVELDPPGHSSSGATRDTGPITSRFCAGSIALGDSLARQVDWHLVGMSITW